MPRFLESWTWAAHHQWCISLRNGRTDVLRGSEACCVGKSSVIASFMDDLGLLDELRLSGSRGLKSPTVTL